MKRLATFITAFLIGFFTNALFDTDMHLFKIKSIIFLVGIFIAFVLRLIDDYKKDNHTFINL